jgi:hypothetical protein
MVFLLCLGAVGEDDPSISHRKTQYHRELSVPIGLGRELSYHASGDQESTKRKSGKKSSK